jgi:hypothetical protein
MTTEQRELWFRTADTNVWRSPSGIAIEKRPVFLLWMALGGIAASCAFFAFDHLRRPAAAEQQFSAGITRLLLVIGVILDEHQTLTAGAREYAVQSWRR